jgi:hypothetical protein
MMGEANIAHQVANGPEPEAPQLTPAILIERYCKPTMESSWHRETREHSEWFAGGISYAMCCGLEHEGYDEGYEYMYALIEGGWRMMSEFGDWPYVIYLYWPAQESYDKPCIAHYCEGDFGIEVFDSIHSLRAALKDLRPAP